MRASFLILALFLVLNPVTAGAIHAGAAFETNTREPKHSVGVGALQARRHRSDVAAMGTRQGQHRAF